VLRAKLTHRRAAGCTGRAAAAVAHASPRFSCTAADDDAGDDEKRAWQARVTRASQPRVALAAR
jgi:hypothetical protein